MTTDFIGCKLESVMIKTVEGKDCEVCGRHEAVVACNGCGAALCAECRVFDLWCYGCGHGDAMVFCMKCYADPTINLWRVSG